MSNEPAVITGARGPADERANIVRAEAAERGAEADPGIPAGERWFQAKFARYRLQLTAPQDQRLPDGRFIRSAPIVAQFDGAMLRLKESKDEQKIKLMEEHPQFGRDFWDFQDMLEQRAKDERDTALGVLADPKQRRLIIEALKADGVDFDLPGPSKKAAKGEATKK